VPVELNEFEYWSQLCLQTFFRGMTRRRPDVKVRRSRPFKPPHILCVVGQIGSGKTEVADLVQNELGYAAINSGQVVADLVGIPAVTDASREAFQESAGRFIASNDGPDRLAAEIARRAAASGNDRVVVDGLRQVRTYTALRELADRQVALLYVYAQPDVALELYGRRAGVMHSMLEFAAIREAAVEAEIPAFLEKADAIIFNWRGRAGYRALVTGFLRGAR
jgi:dephospho-CoA kinase